MIKAYVTSILFCLFALVSVAQNRVIDSLRITLSNNLSLEEKVNTYTKLGQEFFKTQVYNDSAFYYTEMAYDIAKREDLKLAQARTLFNMATINSSLKRYEISIEYYQRSLEVTKTLGLRDQLSSTYNNIGAVYFGMGSYKEAIFNYNKALYLSLESGESARIAVDYMNIGEAEFKLGRLKASKQYLELSKKHLESINWEPSSFFLYYARTLFALGEINEARLSAEKSLSIAQKDKDLLMIAENSELLSKIYEGIENYGVAYSHFDAYVTYKDSLNTAREQNEIEKLKLNFELQKTNKELAFVSKKSNYKNIIYVLIGVGLVLLVFLISRQRKIIKMTRQARDVQTQLIGAKLEYQSTDEDENLPNRSNSGH